MKENKLFRIFFLACLTLSFVQLNAQTKHALIFAIGHYKTWKTISSLNDIPFVQAMLKKQKFEDWNTTIVTDKDATLAGIENSLESLLSRIHQKDIVFIHFSSHGEQIEDDANHDEIDGYDESIVTYNAIHPDSAQDFSKAQAEYFRDDEFGKYIDRIRKKLGPEGNVLVIMDACHSGSGTRGRQNVRGGAKPLVSKNFKIKTSSGQKSADVFFEGNTIQEDERKLATYVVISAARAEELNSEMTVPGEDKSMGSLTYAVSKAFEKLKPGTTYRSLFSEILGTMNEVANMQHPVLEGNGLDNFLFSKNYIQQKKYIEIEELNGTTIKLREGLLSGLDTGATVSVFHSNENEPEKDTPLATGTIIQAEPFSATVKLDKDPGLQQPANGWVFVTKPVYNTKPLIIGIGSTNQKNASKNFSAAEETSIKNILKEFPLVKLDGKPELLVVKGEAKDSLKIADNGFLFHTVDSKNKDSLALQIKNYSRYNFLAKLEIRDPRYDLDIKLIPVINGVADTSLKNQNTVNGITEFTDKDIVQIWVKNRSDNYVYVNILDIQPDGLINPILPNTPKGIRKEDLLIKPGQEKIFDTYKIKLTGPPFGMEIFKIFVAESMINMESVAKPEGALARGNLSVLEKLANDSHNVASRGAESENTAKANGSVYNLLFRIKANNE